MATPVNKEQHEKVMELICAVQQGKKKAVKSIIRGKGHSFNVPDILNCPPKSANGTTALLEACHKANKDASYSLGKHAEALDIVRLLLDYGADPDMEACSSDAGNLVPLHVAVKERNAALTTVLLEGNASINQTNDDGRCALHIYCSGYGWGIKSDLEILNTLISYNADVNLQDKRGQTPLYICINSARNQHDMMRTLLDNGALTNVPDYRGEYPLHKAACLCDEISVQILLESKASVNQTNGDGQSALHKCCMRMRHDEPQLALVNILISYKADVNLQDKNGETPLNICLEKLKFDIAMVLLENGALSTIPDSKGEWPLHKAVRYGEQSLVRKMLEGHASVNQTNLVGQSALHMCSNRFCSIEVLKTLINCTADVNLRDKNGETPLHISLEKHKFDMAMVLLENGALATIPNSAGKWPLHKAVENCDQSLVRKMLDSNASVNQTNHAGQSALHLCFGFSQRYDRFNEIAMTLIGYNANINLQDMNGNTPLHLSMRYFTQTKFGASSESGQKIDLTVFRKLLDAGASVNQTNHAGQSALHLCFGFSQRYERFNEIAMTLISYGADVNLQDRNGNTPLHLSIRFATQTMFVASSESGRRNDLTVFRKLLDAGASVDQTNHDGQSSVHLCCLLPLPEKACIEILTSLISHKADINDQDKNGQTPLHNCLENQYLSHDLQCGLLHVLLLNGAAVNKTDRNGRSALHTFCKESYGNSLPVLTELIKYKADVNLQDKEGQTPMQISCATKNWDLSMALFENGALATTLDNAGKYPLHEVALDNPKAMLGMVNLCAIRQKENIELICETCELAALRMTYPDSFESMHKATVLRIEHNIPKRTLEPLECYGFCKEWETIEELQTYKKDANQLKLQAILAKERIHQGQYEKLGTLIQDELISVVLSESKFGAGALLKRHLNIWSSYMPGGDVDAFLAVVWRAWRNELEEHFESFETMSIVELTQMAIRRVCQISGILPSIITFIMKLYRRNRQVENTSKNEEMLARELLQQLLDTDKGGEQYPIQHQITKQSFKTLAKSITSCDYELMKMLLESGIQVNAVDSYGNTMLHAAVGSLAPNPYVRLFSQKNHVVRTIELLLEKGVYPNAQNQHCMTARDLLGIARQHVEKENITHFELLLQNGVQPYALNQLSVTARNLLGTVRQYVENEDITHMGIIHRINQILLQYERHNSMTLKHMAAVAVKKSGYSYENVLPDALVKFVDSTQIKERHDFRL